MTASASVFRVLLLTVGALLACAVVLFAVGHLVYFFVVLGGATVAAGAMLGWYAFARARTWVGRIVVGVIGIGLIVFGGTLMSAADRVHTLRARAMIASNLHSIWQGLCAYQGQHGCFPTDLRQLIEEELVGQFCLHNPFGEHAAEDGTSYVYVGELRQGDPPTWPIVFDAADVHDDARMVLFLSGEVRAVRKRDFGVMITEFADAFESMRGHAPVFLRD